MFLAYNRALMWDALKPTFTQSGKKGGGLDELGAYIRNLTGGLDSKALGVGSKQREIEGTFLAFSPRLLRSTVSLVSDALMAIPMTATGKGATVRQKESFKTIGQLLTAVHGVAAAAVISHGLSRDMTGTGLWTMLQSRKTRCRENAISVLRLTASTTV